LDVDAVEKDPAEQVRNEARLRMENLLADLGE
jgi:hypothetical protein